MAPAFIGPGPLVVLGVIHHAKDVHDAPGVIDPTDDTEAVVPHVEDDAVANLIGRVKRPPDTPEIGPIGSAGDRVPPE